MCRRKATASAARRLARERGPIDARRLGRLERIGANVLVAVVGGGRAVRQEVPATLLERLEVAGVVAGVDVGGAQRGAPTASRQPGSAGSR